MNFFASCLVAAASFPAFLSFLRTPGWTLRLWRVLVGGHWPKLNIARRSSIEQVTEEPVPMWNFHFSSA